MDNRFPLTPTHSYGDRQLYQNCESPVQVVGCSILDDLWVAGWVIRGMGFGIQTSSGNHSPSGGEKTEM